MADFKELITFNPLVIPKFEIQRFARDPEDVTYRGRRRWSGNHGMGATCSTLKRRCA